MTQGGRRPPGDRPVLTVEDLRVRFDTPAGMLGAVSGVTFSLERGEILAIVGESGSGKTVTATTLAGLLNQQTAEITGSVRLRGTELTTARPSEWRRIRGADIAMIFQDPLSSLNPVHCVGMQIVEMLRLNRDITRKAARQRAHELLDAVGISDPPRVAAAYPHELSGGMRQRAMIAMAVSCDPAVLIADEPTTALDVTIQAQILELLKHLRDTFGTAVILITHDLGVVADVADRVAVMYAGRIVEEATTDELFASPEHPYTWGLLGATPRLDLPRPPTLTAISGETPSLIDPPSGCRFRSRCSHARPECEQRPDLTPVGENHVAACWIPEDERNGLRAAALPFAEPGPS